MSESVVLMDAGNSFIKWQLVRASGARGFEVLIAGRESTAPIVQEAGWSAFSQRLLAAARAHEARTCWVSHVLGPAFASNLQQHLSPLAVHVPKQGHSAQLRTLYEQPAQLGQDRWLNALAVVSQTQSPLNLVVSLGTATTVDAVVHSQLLAALPAPCTTPFTHLGGVIAPGVHTMLQSLNQHGRQLPLAKLAQVQWPQNTLQALGAGVLSAQMGLVQRQLETLVAQFPESAVTVWLTGGDANELISRLALTNAGVELLPEGVLAGLWVARGEVA